FVDLDFPYKWKLTYFVETKWRPMMGFFLQFIQKNSQKFRFFFSEFLEIFYRIFFRNFVEIGHHFASYICSNVLSQCPGYRLLALGLADINKDGFYLTFKSATKTPS